MEKKKKVINVEQVQMMTQQDFKEEFEFRHIEVVFYKCCAMCQNSRLLKNQSKSIKYDLLVCTVIEPAFVVDAGTVCEAYK